MMIRTVILTLIGVLFLTGCRQSESVVSVASVPMDTPEALILKAVTSLDNGEQQAYLECFDASEIEMKVLDSIVSTAQTIIGFRTAFIESYGEEAWEKFQDKEQAQEEADMTFSMGGEEELERALAWKMDPEKSEFIFENTYGPVSIVQKGEGWLIQVNQMFGGMDAKELKGLTETMNTLQAFTLKYQPLIGQPGITPEDLDYQMGKDLMKELFGMSLKQPDRIDLKKYAK